MARPRKNFGIAAYMSSAPYTLIESINVSVTDPQNVNVSNVVGDLSVAVA